MKKIIIGLLIAMLTINCYSQHNEFGIQLSANAFAFKGNATTNTSFINEVGGGKNYTNNPYGNKTAFNWGAHLQVKRITKQKFIYGSSLGFDVFTSKQNILQTIYLIEIPLFPRPNSTTKLEGISKLTTKNITSTIFGGYRIFDKKLKLDVQTGMELNYILSAKEKAKAISDRNNIVYTTNVDRKNLKLDIKPFIQLTASYKKFYVFVSYAKGLPSYAKEIVGGNNGANASLLRFGVGYTF